jgi:ubiquinone biosynthesis protein UbiJ
MNLLETLAGEVLSGIANTGLRLDPELHERLADLEGTALRLELIIPPQSIVLRITAGELRIQPGSEYPVQTVVRGTIADLLALLRGATPSTGLEISGDPALLTRFAALLQAFRPRLDILLPEGLAPGTATANSGPEQVLGLIEEGFDSARRAVVGLTRQGRSAFENLAQNELMTRADQRALERELDELRMSIDRLRARLALAEPPGNAACDDQ